MGDHRGLKLLLDTHIWLWSFLEPERLAPNVAEALDNPRNELWLSSISIWETMILANKERIILEPNPETWVRKALSTFPLREAPINNEVALHSQRLRLTHQDPADRFIVATALVFELTLVSEDAKLNMTKGLPVISSKSAH